MATLPPPAAPTPLPPEPSRRTLSTTSLWLSRCQVVVVFFFANFLFLLYPLKSIFSEFLTPIMWAAILAMLFSPLYTLVQRWCGGRETLAAAVLTLVVTAGIVLPTI